jgi:hypothetical protein
MSKMTALEAKNAFGVFLEMAQREPVTVTRNGRSVGAMFSMADLHAMAEAYLAPPLLTDVVEGRVTVTEALMIEAGRNRRLAKAAADVQAGRLVTADPAFFDDLRNKVLQRAGT